jgi:protein TonB
MVQALTELELTIEPCPDVFTAVEWLTSRSFDLIVADFDCGPEAPFLLNSARDLKLNKAAFTVAVSSRTPNFPDHDEDAPDLILTKPLIPDQVKYALLSNDRFLGCMRAWVARGDFAQPHETTPPSPSRRTSPDPPSPNPHTGRPVEPSPSPRRPYGTNPALNLTFATLDRRQFRSRRPRPRTAHTSRGRNRFVWGTILCVAFVSVGCIFGQPLRVQSVFASVATVYREALEIEARKPSLIATTDAPPAPQRPASISRALSSKTQPALAHPTLDPEPPAETLLASARLNETPLPPAVLIPDSLRRPPPQSAIVRTVNARPSSSLLSQLQPVSLPEDLSQTFLLAKVQPSYPDQALRAGLQGAVTLQAWIAADGTIRDLKLVNGPLLLGKAAVKAVRQWRYKPYLQNGVAVEAETYVTINFKLP